MSDRHLDTLSCLELARQYFIDKREWEHGSTRRRWLKTRLQQTTVALKARDEELTRLRAFVAAPGVGTTPVKNDEDDPRGPMLPDDEKGADA